MQLLLAFITLINLLATLYVLAEGPPRKLAMDGHPQIRFAQVNESIILKCPVESSLDFETFIDWAKGNTTLYMTQGYEITPKGYLKIKSVTNHHAGIYTCEAINGYGSVRINLTLVVDNPEMENKNYTMPIRNSANKTPSYPPTITKRPSSFSSDVGGEATFHCIASGHPLPHIFWLKDGHLIQDSNNYISKRKTHSILKLKRLEKSDAGDYKCIARNKQGEDEMDFSLHVTEPSPPPRIISLDPPQVTIREGSEITFVCEVATRPGVQLHVKWLKRQDKEDSIESNDLNLFRSGRMYYKPLNLTYSEFVSNGGVYKSKLIIRSSCEADSGTYVCLALNDKGFNFKNSTLKVIRRSNTYASTSLFPTASTSLAVTITVAFVITLAVIVFVSHRCCRNKSSEKIMIDRPTMPNIETGSLKQSTAILKKQNKCDMNQYPEIGDPRSTSKLLGIDSSYLYEHSESQTSKSLQDKISLH